MAIWLASQLDFILVLPETDVYLDGASLQPESVCAAAVLGQWGLERQDPRQWSRSCCCNCRRPSSLNAIRMIEAPFPTFEDGYER
jgi:hypothetical protein